MNDIDLLDGRLHTADPAFSIDRSPDGPTGVRVYHEALLRARSTEDHQQHSRRGLRRQPAVPTYISRRSLAIVAAVAVAAIALAVVPGLVSHTPAYAIRKLQNGKIKIDWSINDYRPDATAIAADLREMGVDVQITTTPSSPSAVGSVTAIFQEDQPGDGPPPGLDVTTSGWTIDPRIFHGPITLNVDVPAAPGERYLSADSVFMPGEVLGGLQCALGEPLRPEDVAARLPALGITAIWNVSRPSNSDPRNPPGSVWQDTRVNEVPDGFIAEGYSSDDATIEFTVVADRAALSQYQDGAQLSDAPCTPEQVAPWR